MYTTGIYIAREQFIRHQTVKRMQARSEDFYPCVVRALLHTRVFIKFKSSCAVICRFDIQPSTKNNKNEVKSDVKTWCIKVLGN